MPNYNTTSKFSVSNSGTIPNTVDDLIFFEDINRDQKVVWDAFEQLMSEGDYAAAQDYVKGYADVHGYFADLYNLMVNRLYAMQNLLAINKSNIDSGTAPFDQFVKPEIFKYQTTPDGIKKDQVWIGPSDYFAEEKYSVNKLKITVADGTSANGLSISVDSDGYITINGTSTDSGSIVLGSTQSNANISSNKIWAYYNYYVDGRVPTHNSGAFYFKWRGANPSGVTQQKILTTRTANMHANLMNIGNNETVTLTLQYGYNETYENLKVGFMIVDTTEVAPNQKYMPYTG